MIVADDDVLIREGLVQLLTRSAFDVVGQAGDAGQLMGQVRDLAPDLVVVDNRMPPTRTAEGVETAQEIRRQFPSVGILVLSASVEVDQALELLSGGNRVGYLLKSQITEAGELADVLEQISRGGCVIDRLLVRELLTARHNEDPLTQLSPDEQDLLALVAQGRSDARIAQILGSTEEDAGQKVRSVFARLRLPQPSSDHQRVLAVIAFLETR